MNEKTKKTSEEQKAFEEKVKKIKRRLKTAFNKLVTDVNIRKLAEGSIENAAFMFVQLDELQKYMQENGVTSEYKNGENQYGTKKSPEAEVYNSTMKNYLNCINAIRGFCGKGGKDDEKDEFDLLMK